MKRINKEFLLSFFLFYLTLNLFYPYRSRITNYKVGDISKEDIMAPFDFPVLKNDEELKREMNITSLSVPPVLRAVEYNIEFSGMKKNIPQNIKKMIIDAREKGIVFDKNSLPQSFGDFYEITINDQSKIVTKNDFYSYNEIKKLIYENLLSKYDSIYSSEILKEIEPFIQPNLLLDIAETEKRRENAKKSVSREKSFIKKGQIIVRRNDVITQEILDIINSLKIAEKNTKKTNILTKFIRTQPLIILLIFVFLFILKEIWNGFFSQKKYIIITVLITFGIFWVYRIFQELVLIPLTPVSLCTMLLSLEGGLVSGLIYTFFLTSCFLIFSPYEIFSLLPIILGSIVGSIYIKNLKGRNDIIKLFIYVSTFTAIATLTTEIIQGKNIQKLFVEIIFSILNSGFSIAFLLGLLLIFERIFGISTNFSYLEFSNLSNPILSELIIKAPGSYHHSIMVGNISEAAAEAIGANSIVAKVGGYYHDIGKLERPEYFIENINPQINPHNELPPKLSVSILKSHIYDGVKIAKKYHLPEEIIKIIMEHHGSTIIRSFYEKAKDIYDNVDEKDYSYDGPTPSTKESSIVMLADSVEAASKSADFESEEDIKKLVDKIIEIKLEEKQLDNGNISFKDLKIIKEVFTKRLIAAYHTRIKYPKVSLK
uniref:HDIG domain-containing protein n=1 Tax=candidate division WOR-3 bacterium TaxID=2052148 RepID=A0A7C4Y5R1_UNCW3